VGGRHAATAQLDPQPAVVDDCVARDRIAQAAGGAGALDFDPVAAVVEDDVECVGDEFVADDVVAPNGAIATPEDRF